MKAKNRKRLRVLGKILFVLYIGFLFYFLIFSDWYGREGTGEYHYNLVLFCEIKRILAVSRCFRMGILCKSVRKCPDFHTIWIFYADGKPVSQLFSYPFLQFWSELLCGVLSAGNKSGEF